MSEREVVYVQTPAGGGWFVKAVVAVFLVIVGLFIAQFVEITDLAPSTQFVPTAQVIDRHPNVQVVPHAAATQAPFINAFTGDGMPTEAVVVIPQGNPFLPQ